MVGYFASVSERNSKPRNAGRKCNSPRWSCVSSVTLGISEKGIGVRRSGAEEADSSRAPSIPRKLLALIQIKSAPVPARSVASLPASRLAAHAYYAVARRSSPLSVGLRCVANAPSLRARFHFLPYPRLRRYAACLGLLYFRPASRGSEFRSPAARKLIANFRFIGLHARIYPVPRNPSAMRARNLLEMRWGKR